MILELPRNIYDGGGGGKWHCSTVEETLKKIRFCNDLESFFSLHFLLFPSLIFSFFIFFHASHRLPYFVPLHSPTGTTTSCNDGRPLYCIHTASLPRVSLLYPTPAPSHSPCLTFLFSPRTKEANTRTTTKKEEKSDTILLLDAPEVISFQHP